MWEVHVGCPPTRSIPTRSTKLISWELISCGLALVEANCIRQPERQLRASLIPRLLCGGGGKRAWYTLFAHAPNSLGNLHTTPPHLPAERLHCLDNYTPRGIHMGGFKWKTILLWRYWSALLCSRWSVNFKGEDCISDVLQCLAGMDECIDSSCEWRADYVCHSLSIVYTECGQWQAFLHGRSRLALQKLV